jgi:hypothetical protein
VDYFCAAVSVLERAIFLCLCLCLCLCRFSLLSPLVCLYVLVCIPVPVDQARIHVANLCAELVDYKHAQHEATIEVQAIQVK